MYGIQTNAIAGMLGNMFENDVKMYGIQTNDCLIGKPVGLRTM